MLMVVSTFTITTARTQGGSSSSLVVNKTVWNGESWAHEICDVVKGDVVQFNITVTFHNYNPCENNYIYDIVVEDYLPDGLEYKDTISPRAPNEIVDNKIIWNFTGNEIILQDDESFSIVFRAAATEYGEQMNEVYSYATEFCCGDELNSYDYAEVYVEPRLDVDKKVWDPDAQEWVDHLDSVIKDVDVQFQIIVTYHGGITMKCMKVMDFLPEECLEYADNVYIEINGEKILKGDLRYPEITVTEHSGCGGDKTIILWDWRNVTFALYDGESVIIKFDANVTDYCYEDYTITNMVFAHLWGCYGCNPDNHVGDCDTATVNCRPHKPVFEKTVKSGNSWVENTTARIDDTVTFKIDLTYYGNYNLSNIKIIDTLPKNILEYVKNSSHLKVYHYYEHSVEKIPIQGVASENNTKVKWDIKEALNDSDTLELTFDALVIGLTGDCGECCGINTAEYTAVESVTQHSYSGTDTAKVETFEKIPVKLQICIKKFGIGRVSAVIKNVGEENVSDIEWTINVKGGVLKRINVTAGCIIEKLEKDGKKTVSLPRRSILRKFGRITITVTATVGEETFTETANGFVFGRIILVRPLIRFGR